MINGNVNLEIPLTKCNFFFFCIPQIAISTTNSTNNSSPVGVIRQISQYYVVSICQNIRVTSVVETIP